MGKPGRPRKFEVYYRPLRGKTIEVEYPMPDGKRIPDDTKCTSHRKAREVAEPRYKKLLEEFYAKNPEFQNEAAVLAEEPAEFGKPLSYGRTIQGKIEKHLAQFLSEKRLASPRQYHSAVHCFYNFLGERVASPWGTLKREDFVRFRHYLLDSKKVKRSKNLYARNFRAVMKGLFPEEFLQEVSFTKGDKVASESPGRPFWQEHIRMLLLQEPKEESLVRGMFWLILSGGMQIIDCALMLREDIEKQISVLDRMKTDQGACFPLLPPFVEWYKSREYCEGRWRSPKRTRVCS
jgi:hypothetical protein